MASSSKGRSKTKQLVAIVKDKRDEAVAAREQLIQKIRKQTEDELLPVEQYLSLEDSKAQKKRFEAILKQLNELTTRLHMETVNWGGDSSDASSESDSEEEERARSPVPGSVTRGRVNEFIEK